MNRADGDGARIGVVLIHVMQMDQPSAGTGGFTEEVLYRAELTRQ